MRRLKLATRELGSDPPVEFLLLAIGEIDTYYGTFTLRPDDARAISEGFAATGNDLSIDYDHQSIDARSKSGPIPASGWIGGLDVRDDGLWATEVSWTPAAQKLLADREYRYYSPVVYLDDEGHVMDIDSPGLTNRPATHRMTPLVASRDYEVPDDAAPERNDMGEANRVKVGAALIAALSLGDDASETDAVKRITALREMRREVLSLTGAETVEAAQGVLLSWKAAAEKLPTVEAKVEAFAKERAEAKRERLIEQGLAAGKLSPDQAKEGGWARTVELATLEGFLPTAPRVVDLETRKPPVKQAATITLSQAMDEVRAELSKAGHDPARLSPTQIVVQARAKYPSLRNGDDA